MYGTTALLKMVFVLLKKGLFILLVNLVDYKVANGKEEGVRVQSTKVNYSKERLIKLRGL